MPIMHSKKRALISFGNITFKNIFPFMTSVIFVSRNYLYYHIKKSDKFKDDFWKNNPFFFTLILFIGEFLNIFFSLISHFRIKSLPNNTIKRSQFHKQSKFVYVSSLSLRRVSIWKQYFFFYLSSLAYGITFTVINWFTSSEYDQSTDLSLEMRIFTLFFIGTLSYFFLKYPIYRHQMFAISLVLIGIGLTSIFKFIYDETVSSYGISTAIYLSVYFLSSCREVFQKWLMEFQNQSPIKIVVCESIFGIINSLIVLLCAQQFGFDDLSDLFSRMFGLEVVGYFIGYLILSFADEFVCIYTKYYYSPTIMPVAFSVTIILWNIIILVEIQPTNSQRWYYQYLPSYLLIFIGCLIYNEFIIVYVCGLNEYTKDEIMARSKREVESLNSTLVIENLDEDDNIDDVDY